MTAASIWKAASRLQEDQRKADELDALRRYWTDPSLDENERFLRECVTGCGLPRRRTLPRTDKVVHDPCPCLFKCSYLLNRGWIDKESGRVPTYKEIVDGAAPDDEEDAVRDAQLVK